MPKEVVEELLALPFGLKQIDKIGQYPVYSSEHLVNNFISSVASMRKLRPCLQQVEKLIYQRKIIPVVSYSGFLKYVVMNTFSHNVKLPMTGAYLLEKDVIYIVSDMKLSEFFRSHLDMASDIILHELMHYCSRHNPRVYNAVFKDTNAEFYMAFFKEWIDLEIHKNVAIEINDYAYVNFEMRKNPDSIKYARFLDSVLPPMPSHSMGTRDEMISTIIKGIRNISDLNELVKAAYKDKMLAKLIIAMDTVYTKTFKLNDPETTPIQELIYPSEIGVVLAAKPTSMNYTAIKKIV